MKSVELITPAKAAERAGVSRQAIYDAITRKKLTEHRVLDRIAIDAAELRTWISEPTYQRWTAQGTR